MLEMDFLLHHYFLEEELLEDYYQVLDLKKGFVLLHRHLILLLHRHCLEVFLLFLHHRHQWMLLLKIRLDYHFLLLHLEKFYLLLHYLLLLDNLELILVKLRLDLEMSLMEIQYNIQKLFLQILYNLLLHLHHLGLRHRRHHPILLNSLLY